MWCAENEEEKTKRKEYIFNSMGKNRPWNLEVKKKGIGQWPFALGTVVCMGPSCTKSDFLNIAVILSTGILNGEHSKKIGYN